MLTTKSPAFLPPKIRERIEVDEDGCWIWLGADTGKGDGRSYGKIWWQKKWRSAHIVSFELLVGPVPPGMHLDHKCRCRLCINPYHLEPVTPKENTHRGDAVLYQPQK